MVWPKS
jgi:hypothetical protein